MVYFHRRFVECLGRLGLKFCLNCMLRCKKKPSRDIVVQLPFAQLDGKIYRYLAWDVGQLPFGLVHASLTYRCDSKNLCHVGIVQKSVTLAFDRLVSEDCAFDNLMILLDFRFNESAIVGLPLFYWRSLRVLHFFWVPLFSSEVFFEPLAFSGVPLFEPIMFLGVPLFLLEDF
jgi:hypothetical protein